MYPNRIGDVLEHDISAVRERFIDAIADVFEYASGNRDTAWFSSLLEASGDIHAVAQNIVVSDDNVAEIYARSEHDALRIVDPLIAINDAPLNFNNALRRVDDRRKLQKQAVAHRLDDAAAELADLSVDQVNAMRLKGCKRSRFVFSH